MTSTNRRRALAAGALAMGAGGAVVTTAAPAGAHEVEIRVGDVVGTVGAAHSGIRVCELGPGAGWIMWHTGDGHLGGIVVNDRCDSTQDGDRGGIVDVRVGWDRDRDGDVDQWSGWKRA